MSDQIGYVVGNVKGRDHQYWPTITPAQLAFLGYPARTIGCNLQQLMGLTWRVKRWRFSGNLSLVVSAHAGTSCVQTTSMGIDCTLPDTDRIAVVGATRERDLIGTVDDYFIPGIGSEFYRFVSLRNAGIDMNMNGVVNLDYTFTNTFEPLGCSSASDSSGTNPIGFAMKAFGNANNKEYIVYDSSTGLFYPYLEGFVAAEISSSANEFNGVFETAGSNGTLTVDFQGADDGSGGNIPNLTLPLKLTGTVNFGLIGWHQDGVVVSNCDFTMLALEFWPYKNGAGEQVWDTSSGAQLANPRG